MAFLCLCPALSAHAQSKQDKTGKPAVQPQPQSSAKPKIIPSADPGGVAVAIIGTGVNYTLPQIASRLARDGEGDIIGLDFIDRDNRPYDVLEPGVAANTERPMGTTLASVLLAEGSPRVRLVPVRTQMGEPRAFGGAAAFVASTPARIAIVPFSSANRADWEPFEQAAKTVAANVLFVIPAGDAGQDVDQQPLYPASLKLPNAIVVTVAPTEPGKPSAANFGATTVDVDVVLAADALGLAFDGSGLILGGSTYAAARVARQAASLLGGRASPSAVELKAGLVRFAHPAPGAPSSPGTPPSRTRHGTLPDFVIHGEPRHRF